MKRRIGIESRPAQRCDSIPFRFRFDSIRLDADLVPILPDFESASIRFYFNSIRFECAPPVTLLLLLLLFNLFHISNKYRTSMPPGVLSSVVVSLTVF
jgi:hypothetical protein